MPAILCSDIENPLNGWKISFIDNQIELLKKVMDDNSIINIVEKFHNFPTEMGDCTRLPNLVWVLVWFKILESQTGYWAMKLPVQPVEAETVARRNRCDQD